MPYEKNIVSLQIIFLFCERKEVPMQARHLDRRVYFNELAKTSREYFISYVNKFIDLEAHPRVLEIGCGEGGNLLPFAEQGCYVLGIDFDKNKIDSANAFFEEQGLKGDFICSDFMNVPEPQSVEEKYDLVLIHDVVEHIEMPYKPTFLEHMKRFMRPDAYAYFGFPAWQMPFGGHQQICKSKFVSKLPFIHLLSEKQYRRLLQRHGEDEGKIAELLSIKHSKMPVELFEKFVKAAQLKVVKRTYWVINPHYKVKFHLIPLREIWPFTKIPYLRNFYTTSAWYILHQ